MDIGSVDDDVADGDDDVDEEGANREIPLRPAVTSIEAPLMTVITDWASSSSSSVLEPKAAVIDDGVEVAL